MRTAWHYRTVLLLGLLLSVLAAVEMAMSGKAHVGDWRAAAALGFAAWCLILSLYVFLEGGERKFEPDVFLEVGLLGPITFLRQTARIVAKSKEARVWRVFDLAFWSSEQDLATPKSDLGPHGLRADTRLEDVAQTGAEAVTVALASASAVAVAVAVTVALASAGAVRVVVAVAVALVSAGAGASAAAEAGTVSGAAGDAVLSTIVAVPIAAAVALSGAVAAVFTGTAVGAAVGASVGTAVGAAALASAGVGRGLGVWLRALRGQPDKVSCFAVLVFPFFCWLPVTGTLATMLALRWLSAPAVVVSWLVISLIVTLMWRRGRAVENRTRNPGRSS